MTHAALKPEEVVAQSEAHIDDYLFRGGSDTEKEDIELGEKFWVGEVVRAAWANAKEIEEAWVDHAAKSPPSAEGERESSSFLPGIQPTVDKPIEVAEPKPSPNPNLGQKPVEPVARLVRKADGSTWCVKGNDWRRWLGPLPQLKVIEAQKPKPEPEPEKPEARESEPEPEPEKHHGPVRLILSHPYDIARTFVRLAEDREGKRRYVFVGKVEGELIKEPTLWHWRGDFKCWNGRCYEDVEEDQIRARRSMTFSTKRLNLVVVK